MNNKKDSNTNKKIEESILIKKCIECGVHTMIAKIAGIKWRNEGLNNAIQFLEDWQVFGFARIA